MLTQTQLREDVTKCMTDPIYDIIQNFSLEKSKEWYEKRKKQRDSGNYKQNPAVKKEEVSFDFGSLFELEGNAGQARNLYNNLKKEDFNKGVDWYVYGQNIVVIWYRLKTFDEWLHDGLHEALCQAYATPEDGVRKILERKLGEGVYTNAEIHCFADGEIGMGVLKRLGQYEKFQPIENRDIEKDIEEAKRALEDLEEDNKPVTVLTFKM